MKEFLKFKSVGGGTLEVAIPGTYYIPIDNILMTVGSGFQIAIWQNTPSSSPNGNIRYYAIQVSDNSLTEETVIAFNQALAANPGGKSIEVQLPAGQTITSWNFTFFSINP